MLDTGFVDFKTGNGYTVKRMQEKLIILAKKVNRLYNSLILVSVNS